MVLGNFIPLSMAPQTQFSLRLIVQVVAYSVEAAAPRFPVFIFAYFVNGVGLALQVGCSSAISNGPLIFVGRMLKQLDTLPA